MSRYGQAFALIVCMDGWLVIAPSSATGDDVRWSVMARCPSVDVRWWPAWVRPSMSGYVLRESVRACGQLSAVRPDKSTGISFAILEPILKWRIQDRTGNGDDIMHDIMNDFMHDIINGIMLDIMNDVMNDSMNDIRISDLTTGDHNIGFDYRRSEYRIRLPAIIIWDSITGDHNIGFDYWRSKYRIRLPTITISDSTTDVQNIGFDYRR